LKTGSTTTLDKMLTGRKIDRGRAHHKGERMSEEALQAYEEADSKIHAAIEARRIRSKVAEARKSPNSAGVRWPFELLQNALDPGPRIANDSVALSLRIEPYKVTFIHDSTPFTPADLAALFSGGSNKEFESQETTGRFGTGFLVTHVLSEQTRLTGVLEVPTGYEQFSLVLDRSGDEPAILENIRACKAAMRSAKKLVSIKDINSACFEYSITDATASTLGAVALKDSLPYLYATRPILGSVQLEVAGEGKEVWTPDVMHRETVQGGLVEYRYINVELGTTTKCFTVFRFITGEDAEAGALVLIEQNRESWSVRLPSEEAPRIYREYPLRGSGFVPVNLIIDGKFEPDEDRQKLLMGDIDKQLLKKGFGGAVVAIQYAFDHKWEGAHLLTCASMSSTAFDPGDAEEKQWWAEELKRFAKAMSELPIIESTRGFLPAASGENTAEEEWTADFVVPRWIRESREDETDSDRLWDLVEAATQLAPPIKELSKSWTEITWGWHSLGVDTNRITVTELAKWARGDATTLEDLNVRGDKAEWMTTFLDVVGECWSRRNGVDISVLDGLMPNQRNKLCSPAKLRRDMDIPDELKAICDNMGLEIRDRLLLNDLIRIAKNKGLQSLPKALEDAVSATLSTEEVFEEAKKYIADKLPEDESCEAGMYAIQKGSLHLLNYFWKTMGTEGASQAKQVPLITAQNRSIRWSPQRMMMSPVSYWHLSARPFAHAYPPQRILSELYVGNEEEGIPPTIESLIQWGIVIADPITIDSPAELKDKRLSAITTEDADGLVVTGEKFSQIALLQPEIMLRCGEETVARALLGLVLCHIAPHDPSWREERIAQGRKSGKTVDVSLRSGALWLADLKSRGWVPIPGENGEPAKAMANASTLKKLLDSSWLQNNDAAVNLLSEWFEFDELELRLLGVAPDEQRRQEVRNGLARLVEWAGSNLGLYESLLEDAEIRRQRGREVARLRGLGLAVQEAIKEALEERDPKPKLELVDKGFDYEVTWETQTVLEDGSFKLQVGHYLLEVKATTTGEVRLTSLQAHTASEEADSYALCVVDLRGFSEADLDAPWTGSRAEALAKIVPDIGAGIQTTCKLIGEAKSEPIPILNDAALRYQVTTSVWETGLSISTWIQKILEGLR